MNNPDLKINNLNQQTITDSFETIAKDLILNRALSVNDALFSIIDIEVYYWHENHRDKYARGIPHLRPRGEFELHRFGIDLSLGNNEFEGLGGILICGLYDLTKQTRIAKPMVTKAIYNQIHIGKNTFIMIDKKMPWEKVFRSKRQNLGEPGNDQNKIMYKDTLYKFLALDKELFRDYKGKELIIKDSDLTDGEKTFLLNYTLRK